MSDMNFDYLELAAQAIDAHVDKELKQAALAENPDAYKFLMLLDKYGIRGVKAVEFTVELSNLGKGKEVKDNGADNE